MVTLFRLILSGLALLGLYVGIYAAGTYATRQAVIDELVRAGEARDLETLEGRIRWDALRGFLKSDLAAKSEAVRAGGKGMEIGPDPEEIPGIVDHYITPENMAMLLDLRPVVFPDSAVKDFMRDVSLRGPFAFAVTVGYPQRPAAENVPPTFSEAMFAVTFVFRLDGWTWRTGEMHVPLFMVPREKYERPEIEAFLSDAVR